MDVKRRVADPKEAPPTLIARNIVLLGRTGEVLSSPRTTMNQWSARYPLIPTSARCERGCGRIAWRDKAGALPRAVQLIRDPPVLTGPVPIGVECPALFGVLPELTVDTPSRNYVLSLRNAHGAALRSMTSNVMKMIMPRMSRAVSEVNANGMSRLVVASTST